MKRLRCLFYVLVAMVSSAFASLTVHLQSPFGVSIASFIPHLVLNSDKPDVGATSSTVMKPEDEGWYSYTWNKSLVDFKASDVFSIKGCLEGFTCVDWAEGDNFNVRDFFEGSGEIWIYTDAETGSYTKSFVGPGSKIVWFKSPWGNKVLPQMIFEQDTILMHFSEDKEKCGWFYAPLSPNVMEGKKTQMARFTRFNTPWMSVPEDENLFIDLEDALKKDTIYVDGILAIPSVEIEMGTVGECFDKTRTLHIYNPWRNNSVYRDSSVYVSIDGVRQDSIFGTLTNIAGPALTPLDFDEEKYWLSLSFSDSMVSTAAWKSADAKVQVIRSFNEDVKVHYFSDDNRPTASDLFPSGVYEVWLYTSTAMEEFSISSAPIERKVVRFLSPWKNVSPSLVVDGTGEVVRLNEFSKDTCGWFEGVYYKHLDNWKVYFKQSFGLEKYSMQGIVGEGAEIETLINLDSLLGEHDTVWVYPSGKSDSRPEASLNYPVGKLGDCPAIKISAMFLDWAAESYHDSIDVDFGRVSSGNEYTTVGLNKTCNSGIVTGMVQDTLVNGVPARVDSLNYPWDKCSAAHEIEKWFVPQEVDVDGNSFSNAVCRDLGLQLDDEGFWYLDYTNETGDCNDPVSPGFFPLDDLKYLDFSKTVLNPKFDWDVEVRINKGRHKVYRDTCRHNYGFAMAVSASFKYVKGQYFEIKGDDDVWVYINSRLVLDMGGVHEKAEGAVNLDTIGQDDDALKLKEGKEYTFQMFYTERNAPSSNLKIRTSINLSEEKKYFPIKQSTTDNTIKYSTVQLQTSEKLSCNISGATGVDSIPAKSVYILSGPSLLDGETLQSGMNYGGIFISEGFSEIIIDTVEIMRSKTLLPGVYTLDVYLESDSRQYSQIQFVVPEYPLPVIAFADTAGKAFDPKGYNLLMERIGEEGDTLEPFVPYSVRFMVSYLDQLCTDCNVTVNLSTSDSLVFTDKEGESIASVTTDSTGYATFFVKGVGNVENGSFGVSGDSVANELVWDGINMMRPEPEIDSVVLADIAFADAAGKEFNPKGYNLLMKRIGKKKDTLESFVPYSVRIMVNYLDQLCTDCNVTVNLSTSDPLIFTDENDEPITSVTTDSTGYATFFVKSESDVFNASFSVSGDFVANELVWSGINMAKPRVDYSVPLVLKAEMYDVNGDGNPDSLVIPFDKPFDKVVPDTLSWSFGGNDVHTESGQNSIWPLVLRDSIIALYEPDGFLENVWTGMDDKVYSGLLHYHYSYTDDVGKKSIAMDTAIVDKVGPVIVAANLQVVSDDVVEVVVTLSEGVDTESIDVKSAFAFYRDSEDWTESLDIEEWSAQGNKIKLVFRSSDEDALPMAGDSVRIVPGKLPDWSGNVAHENNPKVAIEGMRRMKIKTPGVVSIRFDEEWAYDDPVVAIAVPTEMSVQDVVDSLGMPGFLLNFDIAEIATNLLLDMSEKADRDSVLSLVKVKWNIRYYTNLGQFVNEAKGTVRCNDKDVFYNVLNPEKSNCLDNPSNVFLEWNARSELGRLVGTGAYIAKVKVKILKDGKKVSSRDDTYTIGIRRIR